MGIVGCGGPQTYDPAMYFCACLANDAGKSSHCIDNWPFVAGNTLSKRRLLSPVSRGCTKRVDVCSPSCASITRCSFAILKQDVLGLGSGWRGCTSTLSMYRIIFSGQSSHEARGACGHNSSLKLAHARFCYTKRSFWHSPFLALQWAYSCRLCY
jgi:hypothetical protein